MPLYGSIESKREIGLYFLFLFLCRLSKLSTKIVADLACSSVKIVALSFLGVFFRVVPLKIVFL